MKIIPTLLNSSSLSRGNAAGVAKLLGILGKVSTQNTSGMKSIRQVMVTPPTVAVSGTATLTGQLWPSTNYKAAVGGVTYLPEGPYFTFTRGGSVGTDGVNYPGVLFTKPKSVNYSSLTDNLTKSSDGSAVVFNHTGTRFEVCTGGYNQYYMIKVDGLYVTATPAQLTGGGLLYILVTFATSATRRIEIIMSDGSNNTFGGVNTDSSNSITPAVVNGPRCIVVGDSFTEGTGATGLSATGYVTTLSDLLGWDDVWWSGVGSTGYLATSSPRGTYRSRLATDVIPYNPDIVIFTGSVNDAAFSGAQIAAEALLCFQQVQAALPNCLIMCVSPFLVTGVGNAGPYLLNARALLKTNVQSVGGIFIDLQQQSLPTHITPQVTTLNTTAATNATSISTVGYLAQNCHYQFADGTSFQVLTAGGLGQSGPYTSTIDNLKTGQTAGATITQVGSCLWTGNGKVGATTGVGNCDAIVSNDGVHPPQAGHDTIAIAIFHQLMFALYGR